MKYGIIGAGAMGYRYGVMLQENAGVDVDFIDTWEPNVEKVREQGGVSVARDHKNRRIIPINMYYPEEYTGHPDVWIIFKKQMQLAEELERDSKAGIFHDDQYVFSAMNGMGHFEKIEKYFPKDHIVCGTAMIATRLDGPANVDFMGPVNSEVMHMAPYNNKPADETMQAIFNDFTAAKMGPVMVDEWKGMCMSKVVFNAVTNTLCTMYEMQMGQFIEYEGVTRMATTLFNEAFDACERAGIHMIESRQEEIDSIIPVSQAYKYHYPSMYQDFSKGRPTEVDYINGYIAKIGREHDYVCRVHEFVVEEVHMAEMMRKYHKPTENVADTKQAEVEA
ncbi:MAG TPA: ketopantoate reductase family protein, partial [Lactobacillus sp.]|uniref:2-dehydropantoate 2-reductase n=1 Tax=Secundilactobacillus silagincola TaxID=1714681 RepID=A0A1Z5J0G1_9LACO|nr:ketopantoate reductase family protein [Secundilactobacillus silagincola]GAX07534.1 2-dehydropantoate 2-reductase [Secundilactobacillus silagincola]HBF75864.1 ketopantoate reductase family protein [Lactobacillus sp.]